MTPIQEQKIDRLIRLLEEQEVGAIARQCSSNRRMIQELVINTVLASAVGYFMFRILDFHFRK